jgi:hypothetical protein
VRLTVKEAARFWALEEATCDAVLNALVAMGFLAKGPDERYRTLHGQQFADGIRHNLKA